MKILADFKENVFKVLEGYMPLSDFEQWLYASEELLDLMSIEVVGEALTFNYKQSDARYEFKKIIFGYFDEDEFMLWKVKANLRDLIEDMGNRDRILYDFYYLGYDGYYFLQDLGYYMYRIEDVYYYGDLQTVLAELKEDARDLLTKIEKQELEKLGFRLADFRPHEGVKNETLVITRKWWSFWKYL